MSNPLTPRRLKEELFRLHTHTSELFDLLRQEREALVARDIDTLQEITNQKETVCGALASAQAQFESQSIRDRLSEIPTELRADLDGQHEKLITLIEQCKHLNQVNGKITHRSQQSNLALLKVLTGEENSLYAQHGRSESNRSRLNSSSVEA